MKTFLLLIPGFLMGCVTAPQKKAELPQDPLLRAIIADVMNLPYDAAQAPGVSVQRVETTVRKD